MPLLFQMPTMPTRSLHSTTQTLPIHGDVTSIPTSSSNSVASSVFPESSFSNTPIAQSKNPTDIVQASRNITSHSQRINAISTSHSIRKNNSYSSVSNTMFTTVSSLSTSTRIVSPKDKFESSRQTRYNKVDIVSTHYTTLSTPFWKLSTKKHKRKPNRRPKFKRTTVQNFAYTKNALISTNVNHEFKYTRSRIPPTRRRSSTTIGSNTFNYRTFSTVHRTPSAPRYNVSIHHTTEASRRANIPHVTISAVISNNANINVRHRPTIAGKN